MPAARRPQQPVLQPPGHGEQEPAHGRSRREVRGELLVDLLRHPVARLPFLEALGQFVLLRPADLQERAVATGADLDMSAGIESEAVSAGMVLQPGAGSGDRELLRRGPQSHHHRADIEIGHRVLLHCELGQHRAELADDQISSCNESGRVEFLDDRTTRYTCGR